MPKWATVTVMDGEGRRHSRDVQAESVYDAAHIFVSSSKNQQGAMPLGGVPPPTLATVFEGVCDGKIYRVEGTNLQKWIVKRREELKGPKGLLFKQRPTLT